MTTPSRFAVALFIGITLVTACASQETRATEEAQAPPSQQGGFIPIDQLPPQDQLPAAPLLVGAYAFVLLMLFGYVVLVSRRLAAIKTEVDRLDSDVKGHGRR